MGKILPPSLSHFSKEFLLLLQLEVSCCMLDSIKKYLISNLSWKKVCCSPLSHAFPSIELSKELNLKERELSLLFLSPQIFLIEKLSYFLWFGQGLPSHYFIEFKTPSMSDYSVKKVVTKWTLIWNVLFTFFFRLPNLLIKLLSK